MLEETFGSSSPASILALPACLRFFLDFARFPNFQGAKGFGNIHRHSSQTHQMVTQSKDRSQETSVSDIKDMIRALQLLETALRMIASRRI